MTLVSRGRFKTLKARPWAYFEVMTVGYRYRERPLGVLPRPHSLTPITFNKSGKKAAPKAESSHGLVQPRHKPS